MIKGKKVVVVLPAYNAEQTLEKTIAEIDRGIVDLIILVDDASKDATVNTAAKMNVLVYRHQVNLGYGGNQKTCYKLALEQGADIVVMLHPDYQYPPKLITAMAGLIASGMFDIVLGSRILGGQALRGGMPVYKYSANRALTFVQNLLLGQKLSEYHTGLRAFSRETLARLPLLEDSDGFVFDNQIIVQALYFGCRIGEITAPSQYTQESSSIGFLKSVGYGLGVLATTGQFLMQKMNLRSFRIFDPQAHKLISGEMPARNH
mgnify:CR=1 FL=1